MVKINIDGTSPGGANAFSEDSKCHLAIESVEDKLAESVQVAVTFLAVASTVPSQVGRKWTEYFSFKPPKGTNKPPVNKFLELACALGVYSRLQWDADAEAKRDPDIELESMIGRTCTAPVTIRKFDEKYWSEQLALGRSTGDNDKIEKATKQLEEKRNKPSVGGDWNNEFNGLGDPESDKIPLDADYIAHFNGELPTKQGTTRRRGAPPVKAASPAPAPAGQTAPVNPAPAPSVASFV